MGHFVSGLRICTPVTPKFTFFEFRLIVPLCLCAPNLLASNPYVYVFLISTQVTLMSMYFEFKRGGPYVYVLWIWTPVTLFFMGFEFLHNWYWRIGATNLHSRDRYVYVLRICKSVTPMCMCFEFALLWPFCLCASYLHASDPHVYGF